MRLLATVAAAAALTLALPAVAQTKAPAASYAEDRAQIENLHARYLFAYDWHDIEGYLDTFAPDGVLDYGGGELKGREEIRAYLLERTASRDKLAAATPASQRLSVGRHIISNHVLEVDGNKARSVAYWTHMSTNRTGYGTVDFFGHYEDDLVKVNGKWLYAVRRVFNQAVADWAGGKNNPARERSAPPRKRVSTGASTGGTN
jgi:hypothetical protein